GRSDPRRVPPRALAISQFRTRAAPGHFGPAAARYLYAFVGVGKRCHPDLAVAFGGEPAAVGRDVAVPWPDFPIAHDKLPAAAQIDCTAGNAERSAVAGNPAGIKREERTPPKLSGRSIADCIGFDDSVRA